MPKPKYEIGSKIMLLGLAAIVGLVIVAVVALGASDVALRLIDAVSSLGMEGTGS